MIHNVGMAERIGRVVLGVVLAVIGISTGGVAMWILLAAAVVMFATSALSYCPVTHALGVSTEGNSIHRLTKA